MKIAIPTIKYKSTIAALVGTASSNINHRDIVYCDEDGKCYMFWENIKGTGIKPYDLNADDLGRWVEDDSLLLQQFTLVDDDYDFPNSTDTEVVDSDLLKKLYAIHSRTLFFIERTITNGNLTKVIKWSDEAKTFKIEETDYTYNGPLLTKSEKTIFDLDGNQIDKIKEEYSYTDNRVSGTARKKVNS